MFLNAVRAEKMKCHNSNMWFAVIILPLLTAGTGAIIYKINASANLYDGNVWQQLWLQTGLFYGYFFFPILISICASYLWRFFVLLNLFRWRYCGGCLWDGFQR